MGKSFYFLNKIRVREELNLVIQQIQLKLPIRGENESLAATTSGGERDVD